LRGALTRLWDDIVATKLYVTGGVAAYHRGISPRNDRVHEAFGRAYDLPLAPAYNETCASFGFAMFCRRLLEATGEARYADWMEQTLFNACLAAVSLDGSRFFYVNPLAWQREDQQLLNNDARERWSGRAACAARCRCGRRWSPGGAGRSTRRSVPCRRAPSRSR
jgi:DUF1680 family protein